MANKQKSNLPYNSIAPQSSEEYVNTQKSVIDMNRNDTF